MHRRRPRSKISGALLSPQPSLLAENAVSWGVVGTQRRDVILHIVVLSLTLLKSFFLAIKTHAICFFFLFLFLHLV